MPGASAAAPPVVVRGLLELLVVSVRVPRPAGEAAGRGRSGHQRGLRSCVSNLIQSLYTRPVDVKRVKVRVKLGKLQFIEVQEQRLYLILSVDVRHLQHERSD